MSKHTPRPWHLEPSVRGGYNVRDEFNNTPAIARTFDVGEPGEAEANAHLIVASPDMYACLRNLYDNGLILRKEGDHIDEVIDALYKAEGVEL